MKNAEPKNVELENVEPQNAALKDAAPKKIEKIVFDKELFKRSVIYNVRTMYRKEMEDATPQQVFQAASHAIKDQIIQNWIDTQRYMKKKNPRWFITCPWSF